MDEVPEAEAPKKEPRKLLQEIKRRDPINPRDVLIILAFIVIVIALVHILISNLVLKTDVNHAKTVSDKVVSDIQDRNGAAVWNLGTQTFQKSYTPTALTKGFKAIEIATLKPPTLDQQFEGTDASGRTVFFIYKYSALKVPYYIRVAIQGKSGTWKLTAITGNANESQLEN